MMFKIVKQLNTIDTFKKIAKLKCSLCIKEHILIVQGILDKYIIFIEIIWYIEGLIAQKNFSLKDSL